MHTEAEKQSYREGCKMVAKAGKERRVLQAKALRFYKEAIMGGKSDDDAHSWVLECLGSLGLTARKLDNYLKRTDNGNPKADAITDAKVLVWITQQEADVNEVREECDAELANIDQLEADGKEWYEVEEIEEIGGKEVRTRTKKMPLTEARFMILEKKAKALDRHFDVIRKMRPDVKMLNIFGGENKFENIEMEDLGRQIRDGEKRHNLEIGDNGNNTGE
jgi:hypothetical protein